MNILDLIDNAIIERAKNKESRNYMGASGLGEPCDAKLWYSYKHPKKILDPRVNRIFDMGNMLEEYMVKLLRDAGVTIYTHDDENKQYGFTKGFIAGNCDGVIVNEIASQFINTVDGVPMPVLAEFKSYNEKRFNELKKVGVKESDPIYYTQVNVYMGEMNLEKCLFLAICKNTCEIYHQYIDYDPIEHNWAINRGVEIGKEKERPSRKYGHKSHFNCKMCNWREECWKSSND